MGSGIYKVYNDFELSVIKDTSISINEAMELIGIAPAQIIYQRKKLGIYSRLPSKKRNKENAEETLLPVRNKRHWTIEEENYLKQNYGNLPMRDLMTHLRRRNDSIRHMATTLAWHWYTAYMTWEDAQTKI